MKYLNYYLLSLALIFSNGLYSMEASKKEADLCEIVEKFSSEPITKEEVDICETVQPFSSEPITKIPRYVYENCNQVTRYKWNDSFLENLKGRVQKLKREAVKKKYKNEEEFVKNAEGYDWIYGLYYLEREYIQKNKDLAECLTIDEVKKINGLFGRLVSDIPGQFRKDNIFWPNHDFTETENVLKDTLREKDKLEAIIIKDFGTIPFPLKIDENENINAWSLYGFLNFLHILYKRPEISIEQIKEWVKETSEIFPENSMRPFKEQVINFKCWIEKRGHIFPEAESIEIEVAKALEKIKGPAMHPIRKAAFIWYEMVRIHISHEANKRTGKALGAPILLGTGYLPPLITAEDEKRYIETLQNGFEDEQGFEKFLNFVVEMIIKTQNKAKLGEL